MTTTEIQQIIADGETIRTEFKSVRAHPDALAAAFVSFLNTEGGVLLLGVEDDGTVTGVDDVDTARQRVDQILTNNIEPRATAYIEPVAHTGQTLLKITLSRGLDRPYHTQSGQCFIRTNAGKRLASREEIRRMYLSVRSLYYDEVTVQGTGIYDVDGFVFDDFLNLAYGYPVDETRTAAERIRLLRNLKAMQNHELTVAGLLFFGRRPQDYLPTARIDFARMSGTTVGENILDHKTVTGRLPQQLEGIEEILRLHLKKAGSIHDFEPETRYEMPLEILRETFVNALVHRDYSLSAPIRVLMFDDRLEIYSPGRLPNGVTVENIRAGIHVERNPVILSLMAKLGLMTRLGTGILRILRLTVEAELPEPVFVESATEFVVTLFRKL